MYLLKALSGLLIGLPAVYILLMVCLCTCSTYSAVSRTSGIRLKSFGGGGVKTTTLMIVSFFKMLIVVVLTGVAQCVGRCATNGKVTGLVPCQGLCLGCRPGPQLRACKRQPIDVSLAHRCFSLSLSLPLSLKINLKNLKKNRCS